MCDVMCDFCDVLQVGLIAYEDRDFGLAIEWMKIARKLKPDDEGTLANLANSHSRHGMLTEALDIMDRMQILRWMSGVMCMSLILFRRVAV